MPFAVLHLPHASTRIPDAERGSFTVSDAALEGELLRFTDRYTDDLYALEPGLATPVIYGVSRLVVDPERFADDALEPMARHGLGAIYTRTLAGGRLRADPDPEERGRLLAAYYHPHHERTASLIGRALAGHGCALVLDGHSYPSEPHPFEDPARPRPEICLGTDRFHTPEWLFDEALANFTGAGFTVERNQPFSGAFVPAPYYGRESAVMALMVELRRGTYMDEATGERLPSFDDVRDRVRRAVAALIVRARASQTSTRARR